MTAQELIKAYYDAFNRQDMDAFLALLDDYVIHDINQNGSESGKKLFTNFMKRMNTCYQEKVKDLVIMTNESGSHAAAEFVVTGVYLATDTGLPAAAGQKYELPCGAFFHIKNDKITRVTNYYNLTDWLKQIND